LPAKCDRQNPRDPSCDELKRSGRDLAAELDTRDGVCASACVYAVLGGAVRDVGAGARLGIHDTSIAPTIRSLDEIGRIVDRPTNLSAEMERSALEASQHAIASYLKEMSINPVLLTAAHAISREKLHFLTREEIVAFGIDRRDAVESTWSLADKSAGLSAVKLIEARDVEAGAFRKAMLTLTCRDKTTVQLQYVHEIGAETESPPGELRVTAGGRSFPLTRLGSAAEGGNRSRVGNHGTELPLAALDEAAFVIETNAPSGHGPDSRPDSPAGPSVYLAVEVASPALGALARRCSGVR
jgi:hypothetical protein